MTRVIWVFRGHIVWEVLSKSRETLISMGLFNEFFVSQPKKCHVNSIGQSSKLDEKLRKRIILKECWE